MSKGQNHMVAAGEDGGLSIFELAAPGKERLSKQIGEFQGKPGV